MIGRVTVFTLSHFSWRDSNGNGQTDRDEITASVDQFSCDHNGFPNTVRFHGV